MKKLFTFLVMFSLLITSYFPVYATAATEEATTEHAETTEYPDDITRKPDIVSEAAIVIDANTGKILYDKKAFDRYYPASTTKIITTLIALEKNIDMDKKIVMSENAVWGIERDSTNIALDVGEEVTMQDLLYATMVKSANECAYMLAEVVAGDTESFAKLMNKKAKELGCTNTNFVTPNGLHDDNHYTCAYDMALITQEALKNDKFREIAGTLNYTVPATNKTSEARPLWNGNKMINPNEPYYYEYCEGGKTGYTTKANNTLVTFAKKDGLELICVLLDCDGSKYCYTDTRALYNYCFNNYTYFYPLSDFSFESDDKTDISENPILDNYYDSLIHDMVDLTVDKKFSLLINKAVDTTKIKPQIELFDKPEDKILGKIHFIYNDEEIGSTDIVSKAPLLSKSLLGDKPKEEEKEKMSDKLKKYAIFITIGIVAAVLIYFLVQSIISLIRRIKRRQGRPNHSRRRHHRKDDDYYF